MSDMTGAFLSQCSTIGLTVYIYSYIVSTVKVDFQLGILVTAEVSGGHFNPTIRSRKQWNGDFLLQSKQRQPMCFDQHCLVCLRKDAVEEIASISHRPGSSIDHALQKIWIWERLQMFFQFLGSALAVLLVLVVYWEQADKLGVQLGLGLASFPGLVDLS